MNFPFLKIKKNPSLSKIGCYGDIKVTNSNDQLTMTSNCSPLLVVTTYNTILVIAEQYNTIQYNGLYFKRVAHDSRETDNPVSLYKIQI